MLRRKMIEDPNARPQLWRRVDSVQPENMQVGYGATRIVMPKGYEAMWFHDWWNSEGSRMRFQKCCWSNRGDTVEEKIHAMQQYDQKYGYTSEFVCFL